jgi:hypothetical protein
VSIRLLNCHTQNPSRSCISRSTSQSHSLSDSISQRASLFTYHLVRAGYSPVPSSRFTLITQKTLVNSPTDYASSGSGSEHRTVTYAELATDPTQLTSSRACHRHVTITIFSNSPMLVLNAALYSSPSQILILLYPARTSTFEKSLVFRTLSTNSWMRGRG